MITKHAMIRWAERAEGVDMASVRRSVRAAGGNANAPRDVLAHLHSAHGLSPERLEAKVLTPEVRAAAGSSTEQRVPVGEAIAVVNGGKVVTVLSKTMVRPW
jgi:hypothetical protein